MSALGSPSVTLLGSLNLLSVIKNLIILIGQQSSQRGDTEKAFGHNVISLLALCAQMFYCFHVLGDS